MSPGAGSARRVAGTVAPFYGHNVFPQVGPTDRTTNDAYECAYDRVTKGMSACISARRPDRCTSRYRAHLHAPTTNHDCARVHDHIRTRHTERSRRHSRTRDHPRARDRQRARMPSHHRQCVRVGRRLSVLVRPRRSTVPHTRGHPPADAHRQHLLYVHRRARTHERERSDDARRAYAETTKQGPAHSRPHAPRSAPLPAGPHTGSRASGCARTLPPMPTDAPARTPTRTGALTVTRRHKRRRVSLPGDRGASV